MDLWRPSLLRCHTGCGHTICRKVIGRKMQCATATHPLRDFVISMYLSSADDNHNFVSVLVLLVSVRLLQFGSQQIIIAPWRGYNPMPVVSGSDLPLSLPWARYIRHFFAPARPADRRLWPPCRLFVCSLCGKGFRKAVGAVAWDPMGGTMLWPASRV